MSQNLLQLPTVSFRAEHLKSVRVDPYRRMMAYEHIVDTTLFFAPHSGGVKRYLIAKHQFLSRRSHVRHSMLVPGPRDALSESGVAELRSPAIPFGGGYRVPLRMKAWRDALVSLQPDIIEAGDPYHVSWAALAAADRLGVPCVGFVHSDLSNLVTARFGRIAGRCADAYLRDLYRRFDLLLAPSAAMASRLKAAGVDRVLVQPLGVDEEIFHPSRIDPGLREKLGLPRETRLLIFAGRISREKRIPLLQSAIEELGAPYHLLLVGSNTNQRLSPRVTMLAFQQDSRQLASLLASADALVHAGNGETFGLVVVEAMACGRPVIGVRSGAVPELITPDVGLLAEPNQRSALKDAIHALYERNLDSMGKSARARVEQHYTWCKVLSLQIHRYAGLGRYSLEGSRDEFKLPIRDESLRLHRRA